MNRLARLLAVLAAAPLSGAVLIQDPFADGGRTNGADSLDAAWFIMGSGPTLSFGSDSTTGPDEGSADGYLSYVSAQSARGILAAFPTQTLGVGESINVRFDLAWTTAPSDTAALRFGLYDSDGLTLADGGIAGAASGYLVRFRSPGGGTSDIHRELGTNGNILSGSDTSTVAGTGVIASNAATGTATHAYAFTITRTTSSTLAFDLFLDGTKLTTTTPTLGSVTNFDFDLVAIGTGISVTQGFRLDNVVVEVVPIPEPSTMGLAAVLGAAGLVVLRRRRR